VGRERGDEVGPAHDHPRLGTAEELVTGERHQRGAGLDGLADAGLVLQPRRPVREPRRRLVEQPRAGVDHHRRTQRRELGDGSRFDEAHHPVVRRVHLEDEGGVGPDRGCVVGGPGAVGGAHFDEPAAGLGHDLGHPEAAADLDQLAPGYDDLTAAGQRRQREQHRRRVVVDDEAGFGTARPGEQRPCVFVPRSPLAAVHAVLEVGVTATDRPSGGERVVSDRRPTEVRVHDDAGGVDDGTQEAVPEPLDATARVGDHLVDRDRVLRPLPA
jgi:hypothetical protein